MSEGMFYLGIFFLVIIFAGDPDIADRVIYGDKVSECFNEK